MAIAKSNIIVSFVSYFSLPLHGASTIRGDCFRPGQDSSGAPYIIKILSKIIGFHLR